jgi:pimeloyl-ACP methyl ester carboxylesterase
LESLPALATAQSNRSADRPGQVASTKPTIALVHGAWADASSWDAVIPVLEQEGYTVDAPPNPLRGLTSESAYLASFLKTISGPIVLVGHSSGGAVITNAATGNANVKALVYVDAFKPARGKTPEHLRFSKPGSRLAGGGNLSNVVNFAVDPSLPKGDSDLYLEVAPGQDHAGFATYVPAPEAAVLAATQRPLALGAFTAPSGTPASASIPSWAVIGREDRAIPPAELTFMADRAHSQITYVTAGHLSMITQPRAVAAAITKAATSLGS